MTISHDNHERWKSTSTYEEQLWDEAQLADMIKEEKFIRRFPSGAVRSDDRGRVRPDFLSPYALREVALHFTGNENDFGATNYFFGIKPGDVNPSISRHYLDLQEAFAENDKDRVREELRAIAANCIMALHQIVLEEKGLYKEVHEKTEYVRIVDNYIKKG